MMTPRDMIRATPGQSVKRDILVLGLDILRFGV